MTPDEHDNWLVPQIDPLRCDGCGLCVQVCPQGALAVQDGCAVVVNTAACQYHGHCERICPQQAIQRPFLIFPLTAPSTTAPSVFQHSYLTEKKP